MLSSSSESSSSLSLSLLNAQVFFIKKLLEGNFEIQSFSKFRVLCETLNDSSKVKKAQSTFVRLCDAKTETEREREKE